jgi:peptide/nickel transport system substrate-binding protein
MERPRISRRRLAATALLVSMALVAAGCGDDDDDAADVSDSSAATSQATSGEAATTAASTGGETATTTAAEDAPTRGGSVTYIAQVERQSLDPLTLATNSEAAGVSFYYNVFGALLYLDPDGTVQPWLAESIETSDAGTTWEMKLRPGVKFSDDTPLDAAAVVANWDRLKDPANASPGAGNFANIASYTAVDATTIQIVLKTPNALFPNAIAGGTMTFIGSPAAITARGADFAVNPVGAGPFVVKERVPGSKTVYTRSPTYYDAANVYLDEVVQLPVADETQKQNAFKTGAAQLVWTGQLPTVEAIEAAGGTITDYAWVGNTSILFNMHGPPFTDHAVRVAFLQALDRDVVSQAFSSGVENPVPPGFVNETAGIFDPAAVYPKPDLAAAQKAIDAYVAANGPIDVTMLSVAGSQPTLDATTVIKDQLEKLEGVSLTIETVDQSALTKTLREGGWDMSLSGVVGVSPDPALYNTFHSTGPFNLSGYSNPGVDAALDAARATSDPAKQQDAYSKLQELITADAFFPPAVSSAFHLGAAAELHVVAIADGTPRFDQMWLEQ